MGFANVNKSEEAIKDSGGGSKYLSFSGVYPVTIVGAFASEGTGGSTSVDFCVEHDGQVQVVYGNLRVFNNDGTENKIGMGTFNKLAVIAGLDTVSDPIEGELPIGKDQAMTDVALLDDFTDLECQMQIQLEYSIFSGNIQEKKVIRNFWTADGSSAAEVTNDKDHGKNLETTLEKYASNITYKDDLTPEAIAAWVADGRPKGTAGKAGGAKANAPKMSTGPKKAKFGK